MKKIATAVAAAALLVTLAAPAGAAVAPSGNETAQSRSGSVHECYGGHAGRARGNCYDEREPQHDGSGFLLF